MTHEGLDEIWYLEMLAILEGLESKTGKGMKVRRRKKQALARLNSDFDSTVQ